MFTIFHAGMKKLRTITGYTPTSFASALAVIFTPQRDFWRYFDVKSAVTLVCVYKVTRRTLQTWLDAMVMDISLRKEVLPILVQLPSTTFYARLVAVFNLMNFTYITTVQLPVAREQHNLPPDLLSKQQKDKQCERVRRGRQVEVVLAKCIGKGWGVFTAQQIEQGEFVAEYTGELISSREMRRRYRDCYDRRGLNYVLSLREHMAQQGHSTLDFDVVRTNVDATCSGNLTRFINHSCSPNLDVKAIRVDSFVPRLALFAQKHINVGEELTFDYGNGSRDAKNRETEQIGSRPCRCRAPKCRGYLPSVS